MDVIFNNSQRSKKHITSLDRGWAASLCGFCSVRTIWHLWQSVILSLCSNLFQTPFFLMSHHLIRESGLHKMPKGISVSCRLLFWCNLPKYLENVGQTNLPHFFFQLEHWHSFFSKSLPCVVNWQEILLAIYSSYFVLLIVLDFELSAYRFTLMYPAGG